MATARTRATRNARDLRPEPNALAACPGGPCRWPTNRSRRGNESDTSSNSGAGGGKGQDAESSARSPSLIERIVAATGMAIDIAKFAMRSAPAPAPNVSTRHSTAICPSEPEGATTKGEANGELAATALRSREHQVRKVDTGNQQNKAGNRRDDPQRPAQLRARRCITCCGRHQVGALAISLPTLCFTLSGGRLHDELLPETVDRRGGLPTAGAVIQTADDLQPRITTPQRRDRGNSARSARSVRTSEAAATHQMERRGSAP